VHMKGSQDFDQDINLRLQKINQYY